MNRNWKKKSSINENKLWVIFFLAYSALIALLFMQKHLKLKKRWPNSVIYHGCFLMVFLGAGIFFWGVFSTSFIYFTGIFSFSFEAGDHISPGQVGWKPGIYIPSLTRAIHFQVELRKLLVPKNQALLMWSVPASSERTFQKEHRLGKPWIWVTDLKF